MNKVYQTKFGPPNGNCMSACVASILELDIRDVPNFHGRDVWYEMWQNWLSERGLHFINLEVDHGYRPACYWIGDPDSPRDNNIKHAVVCVGYNIVHDPYPPNAIKSEVCDIKTCDSIIVIALGPKL